MAWLQEGALPPLLLLVTGGCEEEQTHACRLLAILAQAVPTHGLFREHMVRQRHDCRCRTRPGRARPYNSDDSVHLQLQPFRQEPAPGLGPALLLLLQVVPTILQLLAKDGLSATIAEHAASVLSLLAQNPDTHFHMVGCGAVPALMPYLAAGEARGEGRQGRARAFRLA